MIRYIYRLNSLNQESELYLPTEHDVYALEYLKDTYGVNDLFYLARDGKVILDKRTPSFSCSVPEEKRTEECRRCILGRKNS